MYTISMSILGIEVQAHLVPRAFLGGFLHKLRNAID